MANRVVITGIGIISSHGIGVKNFFENILQKRNFIKPIPEKFLKKYGFKSKYYVPLPDINLSDYDIDLKFEKLMDKNSIISLAAAKLAYEDANIIFKKIQNRFYNESCINDEIILGTGFGSLNKCFSSYLSHKFDEFDNKIELFERKRFNRFIVPQMMPNAVSAWISQLFNLNGPSYTINTACSSGLYAIGEAYRKIKHGYNNRIVTGGIECFNDEDGAVMRGFDSLSVLTKTSNGLPLPFSKNRSGFLFSQGGACVLILENYNCAIKRNAEIYAEIVGFENNSDSYNILQMNPGGNQIKKIIRNLILSKKIDYINSHGTGTLQNDEIESKIFLEIFGKKSEQPYINSTKGIMGHTIGASAAFETAISALSIKKQIVHSNVIDNDYFEFLNLPKENITADINYVMNLSYGFGGHNAGLLLKKINGKNNV
jgi:3-oxoacyl-[acyl-carrier-protein] synthase II